MNGKQTTSASTQKIIFIPFLIQIMTSTYTANLELSPATETRLIRLAEASVIDEFRPQLFKQRDLGMHLKLPWGNNAACLFDFLGLKQQKQLLCCNDKVEYVRVCFEFPIILSFKCFIIIQFCCMHMT